jgi:hypothetical protein
LGWEGAVYLKYHVVMSQENDQKIMYEVHLNLSVATTIRFEIYLWCWDSKNTSATVSTWWTVSGSGWLHTWFLKLATWYLANEAPKLHSKEKEGVWTKKPVTQQ